MTPLRTLIDSRALPLPLSHLFLFLQWPTGCAAALLEHQMHLHLLMQPTLWLRRSPCMFDFQWRVAASGTIKHASETNETHL